MSFKTQRQVDGTYVSLLESNLTLSITLANGLCRFIGAFMRLLFGVLQILQGR